nr:zinc finger BED domain-containing protein RICESLEEPER 2-like [Ipomoea batatas]
MNTTVLFKKIDRLKLARFSEALGADFTLGPHKTRGHVNLKLLLSEYFTFVGEKFKSIICENLKCKRMPRKWSDTKNKVDCGVYLMRHMESYVGESVAKWDCGLTSGDRLQLQMLSLCYMKELCIVDINAHHTSNVAHTLRFLFGQ